MSVKVESFGFIPDGRVAKLIFRIKYGQGLKNTDSKQKEILTLILE